MNTATQTKPPIAAELLERADSPMVAVSATPGDMIRAALKKSINVGELKELYALQKEYDADEARKAWNAAMAEFKRNPPDIVKDMLNKQYGSSYASIAEVVNKTNAALGPHGLNARWDVLSQDKDGMKLACILAHSRGHEVSVELWGPMDTSGTKNPLQSVKSTMTYLKIATFEAVTGVASRAGNADDDGNGGAGNKTPVETDAQRQVREASEAKYNEWLKKIKDCATLSDFEGQRVDLIAAYGGSPNKVPKGLRDLCREKREQLAPGSAQQTL